MWLRHTDEMDGDYDIQTGWIVTTTYRRDGLWLRHKHGMDCYYEIQSCHNSSRLYIVVTIHPICMSSQSIPYAWRSHNSSRLYVVLTIHPTDGMDGDDIEMGWIVTTTYRLDWWWLRHTEGMDYDYHIQMGWIVPTTYRWDGLMSSPSIPSVCRTYNPSRLYVVLKIHPVCMS
jgi:hypothetical protein